MGVPIGKCLSAACLLAAIAVRVAAAAPSNDDRFDDGDGRDHRTLKLTILQTTDLHHHANGTDHVGLDVDPLAASSLTGSYARIAAYVNYVRATAERPVVLVTRVIGPWAPSTI